MPRLTPVSTLALYAARRDAPQTVRPSDARAAQHGIRWHEGLTSSRRRGTGPRWIWAAAVALLAAVAVIRAISG